MSLALIVSVAVLVLPIQGETPQPRKSSCCASMQKAGEPERLWRAPHESEAG